MVNTRASHAVSRDGIWTADWVFFVMVPMVMVLIVMIMVTFGGIAASAPENRKDPSCHR